MTNTSDGTTAAIKVGNFATNPPLPRGATQNWQNARYSAVAMHIAVTSRIEVVPGVSKADADTKATSGVPKPRKAETATRKPT